MTRSVFYGFGAFVGSITGPTTCGWWADDPVNLGWDHTKLISTDLSKNPEAVRRGLIQVTDIQADDYEGYAFGGLTQIGPMWPGGKITGNIWVESNYWAGLGSNQPDRVGAGIAAMPYEFCSVLYWDGDLAGRRFHGYHAEIKSTKNNLALVAIYAPGTSQRTGQQPWGQWWLDLAQHAHPMEPDFTVIGVAATAPKTGALFLDAKVASALILPASKNPKWTGGVGRRRGRGRRARAA